MDGTLQQDDNGVYSASGPEGANGQTQSFFSPLSNGGLFGELELYAMGLLTPEDVTQSIQIARDAARVNHFQGTFTASRIDTFDIDDVIALDGSRVPASDVAQSDFRILTIFVTNNVFSTAESGRLARGVRLLSEQDVNPAFQPYVVRSFHQATRGLGTMQTDGLMYTLGNAPPKLSAIGPKSVSEGDELRLTADASDTNTPEDTLSYSLDEGAPNGASIDPATGEFSWIPEETHGPGVYEVTIRVRDSGSPPLEDFETFEITVGEVNVFPEFDSIGDQSIDEGMELRFTAQASDTDTPENTLTYSLDGGSPAGASIDPATGEFAWIPDESHGPGSYEVTIRVSDDGSPSLSDSETIEITVGEVNVPPALVSIGDQSIAEGMQLRFTAQASDTDTPENTLTYSLDEGAPTGASINPATGEFTWIPDETHGPGSYGVTIRVSDDGSPPLDDFEAITVTVDDTHQSSALDITGSGKPNPFQDGVLAVRYMLGQPDANLEDPRLIPDGAARTTAAQIRAHFDAVGDALDANGDGTIHPFQDGFLIVRYLLGQPDSSLENAPLIPDGSTRKTGAAIRAYLDSLMPSDAEGEQISEETGPVAFVNSADVNDDGSVTKQDALDVINEISSGGLRMRFDTNGDGKLTLADALNVINSLARNVTVQVTWPSADNRNRVDKLLGGDEITRGFDLLSNHDPHESPMHAAKLRKG